jgi:hypothetical protein
MSENEVSKMSMNFLVTPGVMQSKLPFELFEGLSNAISEITEENGEKYNKNLLGHMKEEYSLNHIVPNMAPFIEAMAKEWDEGTPGHIGTFEEAAKSDRYRLYLSSMWVNKQKKYEFNPVHHHSGALSFVIWINIPYDLKEEEAYFPPVSGQGFDPDGTDGASTSKFTFFHTDALGSLRPTPLPVDKSWEGTILMFPSTLHHCVYPFYTSDDYRISVSGNIRIDGINGTGVEGDADLNK